MDDVATVLSILASVSSIAANLAAWLYHRKNRSE